jgi:hypothetical protein
MAITGTNYAEPMTSSAVNTANVADFSAKALDLMQRRQVSADEIDTFEQILAKTANHADAKQALRDLSPSEREVLRKVHSLAQPIQVGTLTNEGAANLLLAPGSQRDFNNDGLLTTGAAHSFAFPPENAPASFKKAWEKATEGKSILDVPTHMVFAVGLANLGREPGDPNWVNPYASADFDYVGKVEQIIDSIEYQYNNHMMSLEQYQKNRQFYNKLRDEMSA